VHHRLPAGRAGCGGEGDRAEVTAVQGNVAKFADLDRLYAVMKEKHGKVDE
jgi:hypothetical protein